MFNSLLLLAPLASFAFSPVGRSNPNVVKSRGPIARCSHLLCSTSSKPVFFDPLEQFELDEGDRPPPNKLPLLIVLPGLDGSGLTAWTQYPELGLAYDIRVMRIPADDRSDFESIADMVTAAIADARSSGREAYVLGESMGAGIALQQAAQSESTDAPTGIVLVSPATGWDRTWLGRIRYQVAELPDPLLSLVILLTSYQLLDLDQIWTTLRRVVTGERAPILNTPQRLKYTWKVVQAMPQAFAQPASTVRYRFFEWAEPTLALGRNLSQLSLPPMLVVAGTADLRVSAKEEAARLQAAAQGPCDVHLVPGAGHAGVTDDRLNLREVMDAWRRERRLKQD